MAPQKLDLSNIHDLTQKEMLVAVLTSLNSICDACQQMSERIAIQNGRVSKLENWRNYIMGGLSIVCITVGILGGYLVSRLP